MNINISNASGEPIYLQIVNQIKTMILEGKLKEGDALPSMRILATQLRISFMTTKRAYEELERDGFIESYTGRGSFVKAQNMELYREEQLSEIDPADIVSARVNSFGAEVMVSNREEASYKYSGMILDPTTLEEIMLYYVNRDKKEWA
ncbi:MAG: GntR family transcriptional regulator [Oscillospiraceae bacterium]|nr:GntR family transcriptional regulator [Oscillospiraceae bacterium]